MPTFAWQGKAASGASQRGSLEAPSRDHALQELRRQGVIVTALHEPTTFRVPAAMSPGAGSADSSPLQAIFDYFGFTGVSQKDLAIYTRKFAQMLRAGLDYGHIFSILGDEAENRRLGRISQRVHNDIVQGNNLTGAMRKYPTVFPPVFLSMVHAGEIAGRLDSIMFELARVYDKEVELRQNIMSRMYYPLFLLAVALLLIGFAIVFLPRIAGLGAESQAIFGRFFSWETYVFVVMFYGGIAAALLWLRTKPGYAFFRATVVYVPYIGILLKKLSLIRFSRLMAAMWASGVPLFESLEVAEETVAEPYLKAAVRETADRVNTGEDLGDSLRATGVFPERVWMLVKTGEAAGDVETMFLKIAEYYELEAEAQGNIVAVAGYFVVYGIIAITVGFFVLSAWSGYFGIINDMVDGNF